MKVKTILKDIKSGAVALGSAMLRFLFFMLVAGFELYHSAKNTVNKEV